MPLSGEEIATVVAELEGPLAGARLLKVAGRDEHSLVMRLRLAGSAGAAGRKVALLLSARPGLARVHLLPDGEPAGGEPASAPPFAAWLASRIAGSRLLAVRLPGRGRAVELDLEAPAREGTGGGVASGEGASGGATSPSTEPQRRARLVLAAELGGPRPNLVLLDAGRRMLGSLRPVEKPGERGGGELRQGERYLPPAPPPHPKAMAALTASPWRYLPGGGAAEPAAAGSPAQAGIEALFPFNFALGRYSEALEARALLEERRRSLLQGLKAARSKRQRLLDRLQGDLARARQARESGRLGELLKAELPRLKRGMRSAEVVDYYSSDLGRLTVPLDPSLGPAENVERYFQRSRKAERAIPLIEERAARVEKESRLLEELLAAAQEGAEAEVDLAALEARARPLLGARRVRRRAGPAAEKASGPRRFISVDGLEILVGRSARENDELTFRLARGNDVFLHTSGRPGAHVVVRVERGRQVPPETLQDAAQLALYFSLPQRGGGALLAAAAGDRGASGDVDYTEVKHVRKPRGAGPGKVLLARHHTLRVSLSPERLRRLRGAGGAGEPEGGEARGAD